MRGKQLQIEKFDNYLNQNQTPDDQMDCDSITASLNEKIVNSEVIEMLKFELCKKDYLSWIRRQLRF